MFFTINRWKLTGRVVNQALSFKTAGEAEQKGRHDEATYKDQVFERVFEGNWHEFDELKKR